MWFTLGDPAVRYLVISNQTGGDIPYEAGDWNTDSAPPGLTARIGPDPGNTVTLPRLSAVP